MEDYDNALIKMIKDNIISMSEYEQLKRCNLINIKKNLALIKNKNNTMLTNIFGNTFLHLIKKKNGEIIYKNKIILNRLSKKTNIVYTQDQLNAVEQMTKFLSDSDEKYFGLYGYAGTGKTTLVIDYLVNCIEMKYISSLVFTAPTNKALNVMKTKVSDRIKYLLEKYEIEYDQKLSFEMNCEKLKKHNITIEFQTIHRLLRYKTEYTHDGEIIFMKDKENIIDGYNVVVIDECSMIPIGLTYEIFKGAKKSEAKIIFSGDPAQLPPVNEKISTIFITNKNQLNIHNLKKNVPEATPEDHDVFCDIIVNMNKHVLKEIVRTKNNSIMKCSNIIRDWIYDKDDFINISNHTDINFYLFSFDKSAKTKTKWFKEFEACVSTEKDTIIIAWTNEEVKYYNNFIRKSLFKKDNMNEYEKGEMLILNEYHSPKTKTHTENKIKFNTSEKIIVSQLEKCRIEFELLEKMKGKLSVFKNHRAIEGKYNKFIDVLNNKISQINLDGYIMKVYKIDEIDNVYEIYVLQNNSNEQYKMFIGDVIEEIKKFRNEMFEQYQIVSIDTNMIKPLYNEFHSKFINKIASVSYGYAITCHKAQGSNYKNVFVDFYDIVKNNNNEEMRRCVYTAVSRTIDNLYILI